MAVAQKNFSSIPVVDVARALFGKEDARSTAQEKHFPDHGGLFVNVKKNRWYSHGNQTGGDAISLVKYINRCEFTAARQWLSAQGVAKHAKAPELVDRIESELNDAFSDGSVANAPTPRQVDRHRKAARQRRNGQRVAYEPPKGVDLHKLARSSDIRAYRRARLKEGRNNRERH